MYVYIYIYIHIYANMYVYIYINICIFLHTYTYIFLHIYMHHTSYADATQWVPQQGAQIEGSGPEAGNFSKVSSTVISYGRFSSERQLCRD